MSAIVEMLPHGDEARFVRTVVTHDAESITCTALVPATSPYAPRGNASPMLAVEIAAQAAGVHGALVADTDRTRSGLLVGIRELELASAELPVDCELRVSARLIAASPPLAIWEFELSAAKRPLAHGELSVWVATA